MTQRELEAEVAEATGESVRTIRRRGFSIVTPLSVFDPDEDNTEPQMVDWDALAARHLQHAA